MKNRKVVRNVIGLAALVLLAGLVILAYTVQKPKTAAHNDPDSTHGTITFQNDLTYDGAGTLDLLAGVLADDGMGKNVTDQVDAVITSEGTMGRKTVRYTFIDAGGNTVTAKRSLIMNRYHGPVLEVGDGISLSAEDLKDTVNVLKAQKKLWAENGYGKDITAAVRCLRVHLNGTAYEMTFTVTNEFSDTVSVTKTVHITGDIPDPKITLTQSSVTVPEGSMFDPEAWIESADDGSGPVPTEAVEIRSAVDTSCPGAYTVTYRLYSADNSAYVETVLKVNVQ